MTGQPLFQAAMEVRITSPAKGQLILLLRRHNILCFRKAQCRPNPARFALAFPFSPIARLSNGVRMLGNGAPWTRIQGWPYFSETETEFSRACTVPKHTQHTKTYLLRGFKYRLESLRLAECFLSGGKVMGRDLGRLEGKLVCGLETQSAARRGQSCAIILKLPQMKPKELGPRLKCVRTRLKSSTCKSTEQHAYVTKVHPCSTCKGH